MRNSSKSVKRIAKAALFASITLYLGACSSTPKVFGGDARLYIPNERQPAQNIEQYQPIAVNDRDTKNKLAQLEILYSKMSVQMKENSTALERLSQEVTSDTRPDDNREAIMRVTQSVDLINSRLDDVTDRLEAIEISLRTLQASARSRTDASAEAARRADQRSIEGTYAIHLASYRAKRQAELGWTSLKNGLSPLFDTRHPRIIKQEQAGVGTFLRLLIGPYYSQGEALEACDKIRLRSADQYCQVTGFSGDTL